MTEEVRVLNPVQLYRLLDLKRGQRGLPDMKAVARESSVSASIITRLLHWESPSASNVLRLILWAGLMPEEVMTDSPPPSDWIRECATTRAGELISKGKWKCQCDHYVMSIAGPTAHLAMTPESWLKVVDRMEGRDGGVI